MPQRVYVCVEKYLQCPGTQFATLFWTLLPACMEFQDELAVRDYSLLMIFLDMFTTLPGMWPFRFPGICQNTLKNAMDISFPSFSFSMYWFSLLFTPIVSTASSSCDIKQLPLIVFNKCPRGNAIHLEQTLSKMK